MGFDGVEIGMESDLDSSRLCHRSQKGPLVSPEFQENE